MRPATATLLALAAGGAAWVLGGPVLDAVGLGVLGLPARLGLVFLALGLVETGLGRLASTPDQEGRGEHG